MKFEIDPDIRRARTLPAEIYHDPRVLAIQKERLFPRTWQGVAPAFEPGRLVPVSLLDVPLLLTRDENGFHCLSNVCTHRGNILVDQPAKGREIHCRYHGRCFAADGAFRSMPEFEGCLDFPTADDHLPSFSVREFAKLLFVSVRPERDLEIPSLPLPSFDGLAFEGERDYDVHANWALYCDNYLEGFHIPYVHPGLAGTLDYDAYRTELTDQGVLQIGMAAPGEPTFDGKIGAFYYWHFPTTMLNFYPWGLSVNLVQPLAVDRTRVKYLTFVWDASKRSRGPGAGLDRVEQEDEAVVESVQRGVRSPHYHRGRYSPKWETGVHHFHRLMAQALW